MNATVDRTMTQPLDRTIHSRRCHNKVIRCQLLNRHEAACRLHKSAIPEAVHRLFGNVSRRIFIAAILNICRTIWVVAIEKIHVSIIISIIVRILIVVNSIGDSVTCDYRSIRKDHLQ